MGIDFEYVGFPAFLKQFDGGGGATSTDQNREEFFSAYDQSRTLCMTLQRAVNFKEYFRCYVVGQEQVHIMPYDPRAPFHERYVRNPPAYPKELLARVERDARLLCRALGYDLNTVEFACGTAFYAIDCMNPAPSDLNPAPRRTSLDRQRWRISRSEGHRAGRTGRFRWDGFLTG